MDFILGFTGFIIVFAVIVDILQTTFFLSGTGFLSGKISSGIWKMLLKNHQKLYSHKFLSYAGSSIILIVFLFWGILFLTGLTLIYVSSDVSVINARTNLRADFWEKVYYVGFTVTTLGIGDFIAGSRFWQLTTILSSVTGFFLLTLVITYLIPLLSAVKEKKSFASTINNIGSSPNDFLLQISTKNKYNELSNLLIFFIPLTNSITQNHLAYPALHYFHSSNIKTAVAPSVAILDEALTTLIISYPDNYKEISILIDPARDAINNLLQTLEGSYFGAENDIPDIPESKIFEDFNYSNMNEEKNKFYNTLSDRRKLLLAYVKNDGWEWKDIVK